ncbi:MAG TPA: AbrB/MazE/SpoVT family DNA-binding domain-containing protein [Candidatus Saccharimonadales bacterium]|jgi:AbrB family looped-hinge helix DNA binding protein|nr:AbrB/MazE/SpoVT family DNA-binding domain-containing protein [Candidatus Saccharimonadales bacterium]
MKTITLSSKNQVVIPSSVRLKLGIRSGNKLIVESVTSNRVVLRKEASYKDLMGTLPSQKTDPVNRIREIRNNWE